MPRYPGYFTPFQYYKPYNYRPPIPPSSSSQVQQFQSPPKAENPDTKKNFETNVWLDLFGIKLYFDDVLILSLLFCLYKEQVKDEGLFLALLMLLIS